MWTLLSGLINSAKEFLTVKEEPKTLLIVVRTKPPVGITVEYFDLSWLPEEGPMFQLEYGKEYGIEYDIDYNEPFEVAAKYARDNGYKFLRIDKIDTVTTTIAITH